MKKNYNEFFDETYYTEKLDNGLDVIVFYKPEFLTTACAFGTTYGGLNINQKLNGKEYHFNPGIAHFIEHKLFEAEEKDIFTSFSELGCNVNAFTSYHETVYYFSTTSKEIEAPLNLLLDFVQSLDISEKSVEKEKGIIIQELSTYMQNADNRLLNEAYRSLYKYYPLNYDIGGDESTVSKITKDELEECYKINYHPTSMAVVIVSPLDPEKLINIVKENQSKKVFETSVRPLDNNEIEPDEVNRKEFSFEMDIKKPKHLYGIKIKPDFKDSKDIMYKEACVNFYLKAYFSSINPKYQEWLNSGIINDYFGYEVDFDKDYANILFYCESDDIDLKKLVDEALKDDLINEDILNQIKRRYIGMFFDVFNDVNDFDTGYIRDYLNEDDLFENIKVIMDLTVDDLKKVFNSLDYSNYALVHINPSGK